MGCWKDVKPFSVGSDKITVTDLFGIADHLQVRPNIIWESGVTYFVGQEDQAVSSQTIQVYKYVHSSGTFSYQQVGSGTDSPDTNNHNVAYIWRESPSWYVGQTNLHNNGIDVWQSDTDDVITTWTEQTQIGGKNSYPKFFTEPGTTNVSLGVRLTTPDGLHDVGLRVSDGGIEGTYTTYKLTNNDDEANYWYYPQYPNYYGTNTKQFIVGNLRANATSKFFCHGLFVEDGDYDNWRNAGDTFTKDISVAGITNAEFESDIVFNGTISTPADDLGMMDCIVVDDVWYGVAIKDGEPATDKYIWKLDGTTLTNTKVNIPNLSRGNGFHEMYLYYNGENIVISCRVSDGGVFTSELWATPLDLSSFSQKLRLVMPNETMTLIKLPDNLDEITGEYAGYYQNSNSEVSVFLTSDKFYC